MNELLNTRLPKRDRYELNQLSGLVLRCDWFVHNEQLLMIRNTGTPKLIFISAYLGFKAVPYFVKNILPTIFTPFTLIIASEDYTFPTGNGDARNNFYSQCQTEIQTLFANEYLRKIFVENLDVEHSKCFPLPLGVLKLDNPGYALYENLFHNSSQLEKSIDVLCCHRNHSNLYWQNGYEQQFSKRNRVTQLASNEWKDFVTIVGQQNETEFLRLMRTSKFCLCVQGGGFDPSPKCWQAILCGSIPIVEHTPLDHAYRRYPIVFVDKWDANALSLQLLTEWYKRLKPYYDVGEKRKTVLQMLTLDYWSSIIENVDLNYISSCIDSPASELAKKHYLQCYYGSETFQKNVTNIVVANFCTCGCITIPKELEFNKLFGDVHPNVVKRLLISVENSTVLVVPEYRTKNFSIEISVKECLKTT